MLWFTVWVVLIVGTLAGALWLGLRLYRQVKRFLAQLQETTTVLERLGDRIDELERLRGETAPFTPDLSGTAVERARWRRVLAENRARRSGRRRERRRRTLARWRLDHVLGTAGQRFRMHQIPSTQGGEQ